MSVAPILYNGTPFKKRSDVNDPLSYIGPTPDRIVRYAEFAKDMSAQFIGPMPLTQFFEKFVPEAPSPFSGAVHVFQDVLNGPPKQFEHRFVNAIEQANLCPTVQFLDTHNSPDTNLFYKTMPDISGHRQASESTAGITPTPSIAPPTPVVGSPSPAAQTATATPNADWTIMEIGMEAKTEDPFQDPSATLSSEARKEHNFEKDSEKACQIRGQMIAYAASHQAAQFRTSCFSVLLLNGEARLVRWDRGGAIVSEKFNYTEREDNLVEFLWRFNHMTAEQRGRDLTVSNALPEEIERAKDHLPHGNMHKVVIHDDKDHQDHHFIVSSATDWTLAATGRCTRGWVAFDLATGKRAWLKDSWRIDMAEMEQEVAIYRDLNRLGVRSVPTMLWGGDVAGQSTVTGDYVNESWCCGKHEILKHQHCRLALDVIGRKLQDYRTSKELCRAVSDALDGHYDAYHLAEVLHRDVSGGNILIKDDGTGLLIDWDLSKRVTARAEARRNWRTGTWRFISTAILEQRGKIHELSDDLESFFHVILYHALRYRTASRVLQAFAKDMRHVFDWSSYDEDGHVFGGRGKRSFFQLSTFPPDVLDRILPQPLAELIHDFRGIFNFIYTHPKAFAKPSSQQIEEAKQKLRSHDHFMAALTTYLAQDGWPSDDRAVDMLSGASSGSESKKRSLKQSSAGASGQGSSKRSKRDSSISLNTGSLASGSLAPSMPSLPETDL